MDDGRPRPRVPFHNLADQLEALRRLPGRPSAGHLLEDAFGTSTVTLLARSRHASVRLPERSHGPVSTPSRATLPVATPPPADTPDDPPRPRLASGERRPW
jgi:hypothetical protein